jgi:hypothetical protein
MFAAIQTGSFCIGIYSKSTKRKKPNKKKTVQLFHAIFVV